MKWFIPLLLGLCPYILSAQVEPALLSSSMLTSSHQLYTGEITGWEFYPGIANPDSASQPSIWKPLRPADLSTSMADADDKLSGWLRLKFKMDIDLASKISGFRMGTWAATEVYLDGKHFQSFGQTGANRIGFKEYNPYQKWPSAIFLTPDTLHTLMVQVADRVSPFDHGQLQMQKVNPRAFLVFTTHEYNKGFLHALRQQHISTSVWISTCLLLSLLFWLMYFLHKEESYLKLFAILTTLSTLSSLGTAWSTSPDISYVAHCILDAAWSVFGWSMIGMTAVVLAGIFKAHIPRWIKLFFVAISIFGLVDGFVPGTISKIVAAALSFIIFGYLLFTSWRKIKGAQWAIVVGLLSTLVWLVIWAITRRETVASAILLSFPLSLLVYVALRFRAIQEEIRKSAEHVVALAEEKKKILTTQNELLEQQVEERTASLHQSLTELKSAQALLVQSEKMASLGQLTAGIAHEIQNPLNFVNNFSDVNKELLAEIKEAIEKGNFGEVGNTVTDILANEEKINHHGKRADAIVKGMLQHSRTSSGVKEPTDINALCDEYLRLAYHGLRAKDKSFNAMTKTDFDQSIGKVNVIPQDIGRVILNLITNAFYAVSEKQKALQTPYPLEGGPDYQPIVTVMTKHQLPLSGGRGSDGPIVTISVSDNGSGIPASALDKIFQPFFTTKPTGQGTGLGLSLSYDIVKAHGGELKVETKEGEGSVFIIQLPAN